MLNHFKVNFLSFSTAVVISLIRRQKDNELIQTDKEETP